MFWDNVLFASKLGNVLFENSIFNWNIPQEFDPGHPPFLGFLLAVFWKILGHKIWVGHLLILFFNVGFFYQLHKFISYFINGFKLQFLAFILIIIDPTLSASFVLVNPEIIILFLFLLTINSILFKNNLLKFIGLFFLSIVSYRSMMVFGGIFLYEIIYKVLLEKKSLISTLNFRFLFFYFLASLPGFTFVLWRLITKGWLQSHPNSPWSSLWQFADFKVFIKNLLILFHRYLDFGRVFIFLFILFSLFKIGKPIFKNSKNKQLILLSITSVIFVIIVSLMATNTMGHRYFIISYICITLFAFRVLISFFKKKKIVFAILFIGLLTGNLWVYPKKISQGWDATLAHIPYYSLRLEAIDYLNNNKIEVTDVASFFPNLTSLDNVDLQKDKRSFSEFNSENEYVLYSNVYNLTDNELNTLDNKYSILKEFNKFNIQITIYILKK
jgi:hypothetical protein